MSKERNEVAEAVMKLMVVDDQVALRQKTIDRLKAEQGAFRRVADGAYRTLKGTVSKTNPRRFFSVPTGLVSVRGETYEVKASDSVVIVEAGKPDQVRVERLEEPS